MSIAIVQPRNDKSLGKKLCSMLCLEGPDPPDVVQCKLAWSIFLYNMVLEGQLATKEYFLMNLAGWWNHAVELEWQGRQEAQSLPGWAAGDVPSSMPRCPPGSLRSMQLLLDCLVEMNGRAVCHQHSNGWRNSIVSSPFVLGYKILSHRQNFGRSYDSYKG